MLVTQLTSADELKDSSGAGEPWQVVLSLDSRVHLQPVGRESCGSLMIFDIRTSRCSEDMNKTYGPSDHRLEALQVSNEIWGVISMHQKILLSDIRDAALNMYDICVAWPGWLSRILLWLWQSKRRQVCQRISVVNEMESEWAAHYRPGISTKILCDRWQPSVYQLIKHHVGQVAARYTSLGTFSHLLLFRNLSVYFSFSQGKKREKKKKARAPQCCQREEEGWGRALPHRPLKAGPVLYLRWRSNHRNPVIHRKKKKNQKWLFCLIFYC